MHAFFECMRFPRLKSKANLVGAEGPLNRAPTIIQLLTQERIGYPRHPVYPAINHIPNPLGMNWHASRALLSKLGCKPVLKKTGESMRQIPLFLFHFFFYSSSFDGIFEDPITVLFIKI